jgi:hypothetical protein
MTVMMEFLGALVGTLLSWIGVALLLGGAIAWYILTVLLAQLFYNGNGKSAANTAIWAAFFVLLIGGFVFLYWLFGDQWEIIAAIVLIGAILPLVLAVLLTVSE